VDSVKPSCALAWGGLGDVLGGGARELRQRLTAGLEPIRGNEWVNWRCGLCPEPGSERDLDGRLP
jgi:hypothetical protein